MITTSTYREAPTQTVDVDGTRFAYRRLGPEHGAPVVFLNHLGANLDNWDPRVVDGIAARRPVITFDNRGVGASQGRTPRSVEAMARDVIAFVRALGLEQVDLFGFSLGGSSPRSSRRGNRRWSGGWCSPGPARRAVWASTGSRP
ncbi:MAG: alpha/beta fold hydrolase [Pseudonocardia sp.]|nr:alpha/beta fold hydrolase [Pseudonocardia sp.]